MIGKVVVSGISILLVVGIAIGVIAAVHNKSGKEENLTAQAKAVKAICQPTTYKDVCTDSLQNATSTDPKELIKTIAIVTQEALKRAHKFTEDELVKNHAEDIKKKELEYCKKMLNFSLEDIQEFVDEFESSDLIKNLNDRFDDLWQLMTNVWVYQESCFEEIYEEDLKKSMEDGTSDAKKLTSNTLDIVADLNKILSNFGLSFNLTTNFTHLASRRLLNVDEANDFPKWVSVGDRRLLAGRGLRFRPDAIVAHDGSGQFKTINAALAAYNPPKGLKTRKRYIVYIKAGVYRESVTIEKNQYNVFLYGDGAGKTIVTNNKHVFGTNLRTSETGTVTVYGRGFLAKHMSFENTAGPNGHQAVALLLQADLAVVYDCRIDGYQDTLYYNSGRQFFRNCIISGTVDFIFGMGAAVVQNSLIIVRRGNDGQKNTVTADGNSKGKNAHIGLVIQNCRILPELRLARDPKMKSYLGRPWKEYATTIVRETELGGFIDPAGWMPWEGSNFENSCFYAEYHNRGPGARTNLRVRWKGFKIITNPAEANQFGVGPWIQGYRWLRGTRVPFNL